MVVLVIFLLLIAVVAIGALADARGYQIICLKAEKAAWRELARALKAVDDLEFSGVDWDDDFDNSIFEAIEREERALKRLVAMGECSDTSR